MNPGPCQTARWHKPIGVERSKVSGTAGCLPDSGARRVDRVCSDSPASSAATQPDAIDSTRGFPARWERPPPRAAASLRFPHQSAILVNSAVIAHGVGERNVVAPGLVDPDGDSRNDRGQSLAEAPVPPLRVRTASAAAPEQGDFT